MSAAQDLNIAQLQQIRQQKNMLAAENSREAEKYISNSDEARAEFDKTFQVILGKATEKGMVFWNKLTGLTTEFRKQDDQIRNFMLAGNPDAAQRISATTARATTSEIDALLDEVFELERGRLVEANQGADDAYTKIRSIVISLAVIAAIAALAAAVWIALGINNGLKKIKAVVAAVATGDLDQNIEIKTNDEIKDLVDTVNIMTTNLRDTANLADQIANGDLTVTPKPLSDKDTLGIALLSMVERLRGVVGDALSAADNVSSGSQQLSSGSEQLSQGATEQASSAEEASASMEEMAANIKQNADNAAQTEKIARQSATDAEESGNAVDRAVNAMRTIAEKISIVQ
ncbi:HAMP domain-containing protein, partial [Hoeflea alexandrii]|uniref:HAMP domain-containing protein n=1 Tax=Hoeflea alexandrii TaxID=288436 RepID=UPI003D2F86BD